MGTTKENSSNKVMESNNKSKVKREKILLMILPFWSLLIPPLGISSLKSYLGENGYDVSTDDANTEMAFIDISHKYISTLMEILNTKRLGNFYNMAYEVLRVHSMAFQNYKESDQYSKDDYKELVKILIKENYFCEISNESIKKLDNILEDFYKILTTYITNLIEKKQPTVVGISTYSVTLPATLFAMKLIKKNYPHIKTIMGGGVFTDLLAIDSINFNRFIESTPYIDKLIVGEGEKILLKYLEGELPDNQKVYTVKDISGEIIDLNETGTPDFSDLKMESYNHMGASTSRSCPFQCSFCSETIVWGKYRCKNAEQVVEELKETYQKYKFQLFLFGDCLLNPTISKLSDELIKNNHSFYFDGYLKAGKDITIENARKWRKAGYYRARLGIESGSVNVLELMNKKLTPELIRSSIMNLANAGIKTTTYWVIGHPEETEEDFQQTLDLIEELKDYIYEADCNMFYYSIGSQVESDSWYQKYGVSLIYPEKFTDLLMSQMWQVNASPSREVAFDRVCRFVDHCEKLGLKNPYSFREIYFADKRWKELHKHAVPMITEFRGKEKTITENTEISFND